MAKNLVAHVGESKPDHLIADISFPIQVGSASLAAEQGLLLRGTLLAKTEDGYKMATDETEGDRILADDIFVEGEKIVAEAYLSGSFSTSSIICDGEIEVHRERLREKGIYLKTTIGGVK